MIDADERFMQAALRLGARALGQTAPNPAVGCVIVKAGRIVGRAATAPGGRPHAETQALAQAAEQARGATVYVTLEPCAHQGQTPPCAQALIDAGVARVVVAATDPNPKVQGQGLARLRAAGIEVETDVLAAQAERAHAGFFKVMRHGRPFVTLKLAASLDGRIATATGNSKWITGPQARRLVHAQRATHDAVMVGAGTLRADDPSLTIRDIGINRQPARVVMSRNLDIPLNCALAKAARDIPLYLIHGHDADPNLTAAWSGIGARLLAVPTAGVAGLSCKAALESLAEQGLTRIFCEGGGALAASLLQADLVDELCVFHAGIAIGAEGYPMLGALGLDQLTLAPRFSLVSHASVAGDMMTIWRRSAFSNS